MQLKNKKFIDLFAGIGGFHQALHQFGATCVFASEWDKHASETYYHNYGIKPFGDITKIDEKNIPQHDILCAGFPCQAFSIAGKQKGFEDTRGTLFFEVARIINHHQPSLIMLENVKNLVRHDKGNTLKTILNTLDELGYTVHYDILNASHFGLPQNRERVYLIGFKKDASFSRFSFPKPSNTKTCLEDILEDNPVNAKVVSRPDIQIRKNYKPEIVNSKVLLPNKPIQIGIVNKGGQGERIYHPLGHAITLSAYGGGVGSKTGLYQVNGVIRKLSVRECARIQGFPDNFKISNSLSQAYKQFGNSVAVNVLVAILKQIETIQEVVMTKENFNRQQQIGSNTAKGGFKNEHDVADKFKNHQMDKEAQIWLQIMGYSPDDIQSLEAKHIPTRLSKRTATPYHIPDAAFELTQKHKKADIQIQLSIKDNDIIYRENISLKKSNQSANFNQIDKRAVDTYQEMWGFNDSIAQTLKKFTGEIVPTEQEINRLELRDKRRFYLNELPANDVTEMLNFFKANKTLIFSDILKGRGILSAEWFLVTKKNSDGHYEWILKSINDVINFYANGNIEVSTRGGLKLGKLTAQRKGGTPDPTSLQFKISPNDLFDLE